MPIHQISINLFIMKYFAGLNGVPRPLFRNFIDYELRLNLGRKITTAKNKEKQYKFSITAQRRETFISFTRYRCNLSGDIGNYSFDSLDEG